MHDNNPVASGSETEDDTSKLPAQLEAFIYTNIQPSQVAIKKSHLISTTTLPTMAQSTNNNRMATRPQPITHSTTWHFSPHAIGQYIKPSSIDSISSLALNKPLDLCTIPCTPPSLPLAYISNIFPIQENQCASMSDSPVTTTTTTITQPHHSQSYWKPRPCAYDGCNAFPTNIKAHMITHTGTRSYICTYPSCSASFTLSGSLKRHLLSHSGARPYLCEYSGCSACFNRQHVLKLHMRTHTGEKPYKCTITSCGARFAHMTNLLNHANTHTGAKPFPCTYPGCIAKFCVRYNLKRHMGTHTKERFACLTCSSTFTQNTNLRAHMLKHSCTS